eukprot:756777-Hanusia_phi.AAC.3
MPGPLGLEPSQCRCIAITQCEVTHSENRRGQDVLHSQGSRHHTRQGFASFPILPLISSLLLPALSLRSPK